MFTADFFRTVLPKHISEKSKHSPEGVVTVELHVQFDTTYTIASFVEAADDGLIIETYPEKGSARKNPKEERELGAPQFDFDRIAVSYSTINRVVITTRRTTKTPFGFHSGAWQTKGKTS